MFSHCFLKGLFQRRILAAFLLAALVGAVLPAQPVRGAADFFVTPGGTGSGSQDDPASLAGALTLAGNGDTIYLAAGTYTGSGTAVINLDVSINILGGWDGASSGPVVRDPAIHVSILDGQNTRQGLRI